MSTEVSVIIVNYNSEQVLVPCIESVKDNASKVQYEIIVVDNASDTRSVQFLRQKFPDVKFIINKKNLGFGAANNKGAEAAQGSYLFFLNPDTLLLDNALLRFYHFLEKEKPEAVSCGGNLVTPDGAATTSYGNFPSVLQEIGDMGFRRFFPAYYNKHLKIGKTVKRLSSPVRVPYIVGADIFVKKKAFLEVGGFDEAFFLFYEETDLFSRFHKKGYISYILPEVKIVHLEGPPLMSNGKLNPEKWAIWEKSKYYYFKKHQGSLIAIFVKILQVISLVFHSFFGRTKYPLGKTLRITWRA